MQDKDTLINQLNRLTQDALNIQGGIKKFQEEIQEAQSKIQNLTQNIDRHQGALNYNSILMNSIKSQLEEIELASTKPQ